MYDIGLATPQDTACLPAIELRAGHLFLKIPEVAALPLYLTSADDFARAQRGGRLWVARRAGATPVGFALVERLGTEWHLEEVDVLPDHGRRGLGTALVRTACDWVVAQGESSLTLCTFRQVPWNAPFYTRLSFVPVTDEALTRALRERMQQEGAHGLPPEDRVAMRWMAAS